MKSRGSCSRGNRQFSGPHGLSREVICNIQLCCYVKCLRCLHARGNLPKRGNGLSLRLVFHVPPIFQRSLCPAADLPQGAPRLEWVACLGHGHGDAARLPMRKQPTPSARCPSFALGRHSLESWRASGPKSKADIQKGATMSGIDPKRTSRVHSLDHLVTMGNSGSAQGGVALGLPLC